MADFETGDPVPGAPDSCARAPVHIIGHIQSHGLLFALSEPDLIVRQVSVNVASLLGMSPESVLGHSLEAVLGPQQFSTFRAAIVLEERLGANPFRVLVGQHALEMNCVAHRQDGALIVELEPLHGTHSLEPLSVAAHIQTPIARMEQASDLLTLAQLAASEIRRLSGFDRVMIYRFDEEWNGEVIAEVVGPSPISYLGLRFPASDIPAPARQLFLVNPLRAIADVASAPVPIVPEFDPLTGRPLDLTRSFLRSAAAVHIEYLRNMHVQSTMTVSIVVEHKLWGMIACHDAAPRRVDCSVRSVCELIGQVLASQVVLRIENAALQTRLTSRKMLENYLGRLEASKALVDAEPFQTARLLDLLDADGLVSYIDGVVSSQGVTVRQERLVPIIGKLQKLSTRGIASSNMLSALDRSAESYKSKVSGALYIGLAEDTGEYLLVVRRELVETVFWAGDPTKATRTDEDGKPRPRTSFAAWQEQVRGRSRPWSEEQLESACFLREQLLRLREAQRLHRSEERVRYLAHHDALTGLINRHSIHQRLEQCVSDAVANHSSFAVLFIDLDHFKEFNDRLGHAVGDRILKIVATRMKHNVRAEDVVGRLGGDEFIVIMPGISVEADGCQTAARILGAIEEPLGIEVDAPLRITASIGLSRYPLDGISSEALVSRSDIAMYSVKRKGGNAFAASSRSSSA